MYDGLDSNLQSIYGDYSPPALRALRNIPEAQHHAPAAAYARNFKTKRMD